MSWLAILSFLKSPLGRSIAAALSVVLLLVGVYGAGHHSGVRSEKDAEASRLRTAVKVVVKREATAAKISTTIAAKTEKARVEIRWRTETLIQKVPQYVPSAADADCRISRGFVQLHDAAAAGLPAPASGPDEAAAGVPLSGVLEADIENLGVGYDYRAEVIAWRAWYKLQSETWSKP